HRKIIFLFIDIDVEPQAMKVFFVLQPQTRRVQIDLVPVGKTKIQVGLMKLDMAGKQQHVEQNIPAHGLFGLLLKMQTGNAPETFGGLFEIEIHLVKIHPSPDDTEIRQGSKNIEAQMGVLHLQHRLVEMTGNANIVQVNQRFSSFPLGIDPANVDLGIQTLGQVTIKFDAIIADQIGKAAPELHQYRQSNQEDGTKEIKLFYKIAKRADHLALLNP